MKKRFFRSASPATVLIASVALAACGDDNDRSSGRDEFDTSPATAIKEIGQTRAGLAMALKTYLGGDQAAAAEQASTAYLEHFEYVEVPLGKVDHELTEELEDGLREELVVLIEAGGPDKAVSELVGQLSMNLAKAKRLLTAE